MSAGRICSREVDLAEPRKSAQVAAVRMNARNVGTLVVIDADRKPIGILTDRDLAMKILAHGKNPFQTTVGDVMTSCPQTIDEETSIEDAIGVMRTGPFRRLPVVDDDRQLVGLLSLDDVLSLLAEEFSQIGRMVEREGPAALTKF